MAKEILKFLREIINEPSYSLWRVQVFIIGEGNHKPIIVVDKTQMIFKYILLDAYPPPKIEKIILKNSKNKVLIKNDL